MYQTKKGKAYYLALKILTMASCIPLDNESRFKFLLKSTVIKFVVLCPWLGALSHIIMSTIKQTYVGIYEDLADVTTYSGLVVMIVLFTYHRKKWLRLFLDVTHIDVFGKPHNFQNTERRGNLYTILFIAYSIVGTVIYSLSALLRVPYWRRINEEKNVKELTIRLIPIWLPAASGRRWIEVTIFVLEMISSYVTLLQSIPISILPLLTTDLITSHIDHFKILFKEIFEEEDRNVRSAKFGLCVKYHNHILSMANDLCYLSKITLGFMSLISAVSIGCTSTQMIKDASVGACMYMMGFTFALFTLCHSGQKLMDEISSIHDSVNCSKWYLADVKMMKDVQPILLRCQKPMLMGAFPIGSFNYPLFLTIIKTAYSYVTLLNEAG